MGNKKNKAKKKNAAKKAAEVEDAIEKPDEKGKGNAVEQIELSGPATLPSRVKKNSEEAEIDDDKYKDAVMYAFEGPLNAGEYKKAQKAALAACVHRPLLSPTPEVNAILALAASWDHSQSNRVAALYAKKALEQWEHVDAEFSSVAKTGAPLTTIVFHGYLANFDLAGARTWLDSMERNEGIRQRGLILLVAQLKKRLDNVAGIFRACPSKGESWRMILSCVARYKPTMRGYYPSDPVSGERPRSLIDHCTLKAAHQEGRNVNVLHAGAGDGRHLFQTIFELGALLHRENDNLNSKVTILIVDRHPAAVARLLVLMHLILTTEAQKDKAKRRQLLVSLGFIFGFPIIPLRAHTSLREAATAVADALKSWDNADRNIFHDTIEVPEDIRFPVLAAVLAWTQAYSLRKESQMTRAFIHSYREKVTGLGQWADMAAPFLSKYLLPNPCGNRRDRALWSAAGIVDVPPTIYDSKSPESASESLDKDGPADSDSHSTTDVATAYSEIVDVLCGLFETQADGREVQVETQEALERLVMLEEHVATNWRGNLTLLANCDEVYAGTKPLQYEFFSPFEVAGRLHGFNDDDNQLTEAAQAVSVIEYVTDYFDSVVGMVGLCLERKQFRVILHVDDVFNTMDELHANLSPFLLHEKAFTWLDYNPKTDGHFDVIDLSSIPDKAGGVLAALMHGRPLLRKVPSSRVTYATRDSALRYLRWSEEHNVQSLGTTVPRVYAACYGMKQDEVPPSMQNQSFPMIYGLPLSWRLVPQDDSKEERAEWGQRHVENMLQNLLLRVMVPPGGRPHWRNKIRAQEWFPFNMWTFFRALVHLQDLGFDKESLFRGTNYVLSRTHITSEYGLKSHASDNRHGSWYVMTSVDLQPWSAELTTQCCLWQGLLDFVVGRDKDDTLLPHQIHKYGVKIAARGKEFTDERPEHIVVFVRRVHAFPMDDLHGILTGTVDRELRDVASSIRNEHCHIVTVWEWYEVEERAVFWMRDDVMEEMLRDYPTWDAMVYRTDVWTPVLGPDKTSPLDIVKWEQWGDQDNM